MTLPPETNKRFDEKFGENIVWWQECLAEMRIGDPDFKSLKFFLADEIAKARNEGYKEGVQDGEGTKHGVKRYQMGYEEGRKDEKKLWQENQILEIDGEGKVKQLECVNCKQARVSERERIVRIIEEEVKKYKCGNHK